MSTPALQRPRSRVQPRWKVFVSMMLKDPHGEGGELFDQLLKNSGLSRLGLAQSAGCSHTMIGFIRRGEKACSPDLAAKISAVLGVKTKVLFVENQSRVPAQSATPAGRKVA